MTSVDSDDLAAAGSGTAAVIARPGTGRSVDVLPTPCNGGQTWTWTLYQDFYQGLCLVQPFLFEVRVSAHDPIHPLAGHDYDIECVTSFDGYPLHQAIERHPADLPQVTPDAVLELVEERDLLRNSVNAARAFLRKAAMMCGMEVADPLAPPTDDPSFTIPYRLQLGTVRRWRGQTGRVYRDTDGWFRHHECAGPLSAVSAWRMDGPMTEVTDQVTDEVDHENGEHDQ